MSKVKKGDMHVVGDSVMDIAGSRLWYDRLLLILTENAPPTVRLDMSAVEKIDTACLQLLVAFVLAATGKKVKVEWHACSERFLLAARSLNLNQALRLPQ